MKHYSRFRKAGYTKLSSKYLARKADGKPETSISISKTLNVQKRRKRK